MNLYEHVKNLLTIEENIVRYRYILVKLINSNDLMDCFLRGVKEIILSERLASYGERCSFNVHLTFLVLRRILLFNIQPQRIFVLCMINGGRSV